MYTNNFGRAGFIAAIFASSVMLTSCDSGETGEDPRNETAAAGPAATRTSAGATGDERAAAARAVLSEDMPYAEVDDELVYGYFVAPSDMFEPLPAIIMIHDWWGLNDDVRAMADRLAAEGYIVLAVDLFARQTASTPAAARKLMLTVVEDPELADENIRSAYEFVSATAGAPRVGAIGWRFGGTWSLNTAILLPEDLDASVIYYAQVTDDEDRLRPIGSPILGLFAADDISVKVESVEAFKAALERLRKDYDIRIYEGVKQGFASESAPGYDESAANDAWNRTLDFFGRHLSPDAASPE